MCIAYSKAVDIATSRWYQGGFPHKKKKLKIMKHATMQHGELHMAAYPDSFASSIHLYK